MACRIRHFALLLALLLTVTHVRADPQSTYLQCLTNFESWAETNWHAATYSGAPLDSGYWGDGGASAGNNGGIRGNGGVAVAYAAMVVALPNDPRTSNRLFRVRQALNYNASTHFTGGYLANNGVQWGWNSGSLDNNCSTCNGCADWQSGEWAGSMGLACLLVQSNLIAQGYGATVTAVQNVIASEATHRSTVAPCSLPLSSGDTKAEENGWDGNTPALAAAWMSTSNNASTWLTTAQSYLANTYTVANTNGDPLSSWVSTVTMYPEFALENHGFYHPTYEMVAGMSSGDSLLMARLANTNIAAQMQPHAEHNVSTVWTTNLSYMLFDSGEFAYPSGLDWELHDYEQNSYITWMATHFNDPQARWADSQLSQLVRYRQVINGDGSFIGPSGGGFYREAVEARRTAIAWLHWANADYPSGPTTAPPAAVVSFPDVGVLAQRSQWGFVTASYKDAAIGLGGMVEAAAASVPTNAYVASPALPGGFGHGPLGNPTSGTLSSFTNTANGFDAQILYVNGSSGSTRVYISSSGFSVGVVEIPLPANGVTGSGAGCFTNGIENDPLTGGSRLIEWNGGSSNILNRSSTKLNITNSWVCISGRYGFVSGPGGFIRYAAAGNYDRAGAAQDYLHVIPQTRLAPRYAVWFPSENASNTAFLSSQVSWTTNGSNVVLTFPGPNGSSNSISADLAAGSGLTNGTWTADASGNWSDTTKWSGGAVATGAGSTADFSTLAITADRTVTLDSSRSIGTLKFGDTSSSHNWILNASGGSTLTLDSGSSASPLIAVNQDSATIIAPLAGSNGFTKSAAGTLILNTSNSLSGILYVDTSSTSSSDGAVRIATNAALAGISSIQIRNNTGAGSFSTLQLDGSAGNLLVNQSITSSCRANTVANLENLGGSNTLAGAFLMQTGGSNVVLQCDSGTLALAGPLQYVGSLTSARTFAFYGAGVSLVTGPILDSTLAPLNVSKFGAGTFTLRGTNTFGTSFPAALNLNAGILNFLSLSNLGGPSAAINFNGGQLQFASGNSTDISSRTVSFAAGGATIDTGSNAVVFANPIGNNGSGALVKQGSGSLTLNGSNSYAGPTTVSNGTLIVSGKIGAGRVTVAAGALAGVGGIYGPVTILPSGTLATSASGSGPLAINNSLTNSGKISLVLNKSGAVLTNDSITGLTVISIGGTLSVTNVGSSSLSAGDSFKLFSSASYSGAFTGITPWAPASGLAWNTSTLGSDGTLRVVTATPPTINSFTQSGANLILGATGGPTGGVYLILTTTNIAQPLSTWTPVKTNFFDANGKLTYTNSFNAGTPQQFFVIQVP